MNPIGLMLTLAFCISVFCLSRRAAVLGIIAAVCYITQAQELNIGFHFTSIRLVLLAGLIRVHVRGELRQLQTNAVDRALMAYALSLMVVSVIRAGTFDELVYQTGCLYNVFLSYFVLRCLVHDKEDVVAILERVAYLIIPFALLMIVESRSGRNLFYVFGGVGEYSMVRDGHVRAEGPFRSPITAGSFGATFAMMYAALLFAREGRKRPALLGLLASSIIVICAHSSGPLLGYMLGILGLACWYVRQQMRVIRWVILLALIGLDAVMKAPVWFLMGRISDVVGGGGYDRAYVIDAFVNHFNSWWLLGTSNTGGWVATELVFGGTDLTNQFVSDGVNGGLVGLFLSIMLVFRIFQRVGQSVGQANTEDLIAQKFIWGLGTAYFGSVGILFSVTYFDQMQVIWYFLLACIGSDLIARPSDALVEAANGEAVGSNTDGDAPEGDPSGVGQPAPNANSAAQ